MNRTSTESTAPASNEAREPSALIAFILRRFHQPLRLLLPALVESTRTIEIDTRGEALCPRGLAEHIERMRLDLESHLDKEEKILFPLIRSGRGSVALMPINVMMAEHQDHARSLTRMRALAHDFELPSDAHPSWRALYQQLEGLQAELREHSELEDHVLFPRAAHAETVL